MIIGNYSRRPQTAYSGFAGALARTYYGASGVFFGNQSASINHMMSLDANDKIRMVARIITSGSSKTAPQTVRLKIRKKL